MSRKTRHTRRLLAAWMLLASLMPIAVTKTLHRHELPTLERHDSGQSIDQQADCPICLFVLSAFNIADGNHIQPDTPAAHRQYAAAETRIDTRTVCQARLRAPPAA